MKRTTKIRARREKLRRGRVVSPEFMEFCRQQGCVLKDRHTCDGPVTFHHVNFCGSQKDDTHGFGLCYGGHEHGWSKLSIEALGKVKWQAHWGIDIEAEIARLRKLYEETVRPADKVEEA